MEAFSVDQMITQETMSADMYVFMMRSCGEAIKSIYPSIVSYVSLTIDTLFTHVIKMIQIQKSSHVVLKCREFPDLIVFLMKQILEIIIYEDTPAQWSVTRPLLPLYIIQKEVFFV